MFLFKIHRNFLIRIIYIPNNSPHPSIATSLLNPCQATHPSRCHQVEIQVHLSKPPAWVVEWRGRLQLPLLTYVEKWPYYACIKIESIQTPSRTFNMHRGQLSVVVAEGARTSAGDTLTIMGVVKNEGVREFFWQDFLFFRQSSLSAKSIK